MIRRSISLPVMALGFSALLLSGCTNMTPQEQRVVSGAAIGAATGTIGTAVTGGCISCGAAIGTVVGAGAGYVLDQMNK